MFDQKDNINLINLFAMEMEEMHQVIVAFLSGSIQDKPAANVEVL